MRSSVPSQLQSSKESYTVERGGRSLGIARHWQPVLRMYISPFTTSRTFTVRLLPPRLPGRMSGSTWLHSSSVKSLGYRSLLRSYRARFSIVHIGGLSTTQAAILASQTLDPIQYVPEQALRGVRDCTAPPSIDAADYSGSIGFAGDGSPRLGEVRGLPIRRMA